ncbi:MAG: hypothetical protein AB7F59_13610 [Bdellovibrionales bacterium]
MKRKGCVSAVQVLIIFCTLLILSTPAFAGPRETARKLFERLTGVPLMLNDPRLPQMEAMVQSGQLRAAAQIATNDDNFYNETVRYWAMPMSNKDGTAFAPLNDFVSMFIGITRDQTDARELLTKDFTYVVKGLPAPVPENNTHYLTADQRQMNLRQNLERVDGVSQGKREYAGVLTSRAWAEAHMIMGTNRRALQYSLQVFLCRPIESYMNFELPDNWVRRDVDRRPGGVYKTYQTRCVGCHAGMDALGGAYAHFDFAGNRMLYLQPPFVANKMNQNNRTYPPGNVVLDNSWENLWVNSPIKAGRGLQEFGQMLTQAEEFSTCMARTAYANVCRKNATDVDPKVAETIAMAFVNNGYKIKTLFEEAAIRTECLGE